MWGVFLTFIPIAHFLAYGYLHRLFLSGKSQEELTLPEWGDWKGLFLDGLVFFLILLVFAGVPVGAMAILVKALPGGSFLAMIPLAPAYFIALPLASAAHYLYLLDGNIGNCFNYQGLTGLLKKGARFYWVPTLAFLGLLLMLPFAFFFGAVIYFYLMAYIFKNLESGADKGL